MRKTFFLFAIFSAFIASAQKSYEFAISLPPSLKAITEVDRSLFGNYVGIDKYPYYEVNAAGIFVHSLSIHSISRDSLRETTKYRVKGDWIFGVIKGDSLPCVLDGDNYFFGISQREMIVGNNCKNELKMLSKNEYLLSFEEDGRFIPCKLRFENKTLKVSYFDYSSEDFANLEAVKKKQEITEIDSGVLPIVLLLPTEKEWTKMQQGGIFGQTISYSLR